MKKAFLAVMASVLGLGLLAAGCAAPQKRGVWQGDWNWPYLKWVSQTNLDGDTPKTTIQNKNGTILIFQ